MTRLEEFTKSALMGILSNVTLTENARVLAHQQDDSFEAIVAAVAVAHAKAAIDAIDLEVLNSQIHVSSAAGA